MIPGQSSRFVANSTGSVCAIAFIVPSFPESAVARTSYSRGTALRCSWMDVSGTDVQSTEPRRRRIRRFGARSSLKTGEEIETRTEDSSALDGECSESGNTKTHELQRPESFER